MSPLLTAIPLDGPVLPALLVFARASGMLHGAPVLSAKAVPVPLRLGIAAALTLLLTPTIGAPTSDMPLPRFAWLALGEVLFGLALGFAARLPLALVEMAGTLAGTHAGFAIAEQIDPLTHTQGSVVGRLFQVAAIAAFFSYGLHHALIEAFAGLAVAAPPGTASLSPDFLRALIVEGGELLPLALQATMPALAASLLLNLIFAIVTRFSPAMNLYFGLGMALQCAVGVAALSACLPAVLRAFAVCASALPLAGAAG